MINQCATSLHPEVLQQNIQEFLHFQMSLEKLVQSVLRSEPRGSRTMLGPVVLCLQDDSVGVINSRMALWVLLLLFHHKLYVAAQRA